jgi:hypothetical protein
MVSGSDPIRFDLGRRGSPERRLAERRAIIDAHLELVRARLESGWLGQEHSPLGPRRHVEAVRRRLAVGRNDAAIDDSRYLLTIDAVVDEFFGAREPKLDRALAALGRAVPANDNGGSQ